MMPPPEDDLLCGAHPRNRNREINEINDRTCSGCFIVCSGVLPMQKGRGDEVKYESPAGDYDHREGLANVWVVCLFVQVCRRCSSKK